MSKNKVPIVVGGTGLYIDILLKNFTLPQIEPNRELRNKLYKLDISEIYQILAEKDANAAQIIDKNDRKKIIRAIEIINTTEKPLKDSRGIEDSE